MSGRRREERKLAGRMLAPSLLIIALVAAYPVGYGIWLSLNEYSVRVPGLSRWAGLSNYSEAISSPDFLGALGTTLLFTVLSVGLELVLGLGMAIVMHEALRGKGLVRTVVLVPWATLTVVTAFIWRTVFEPELGVVNAVLGTEVVWLGERGYALAVMILADVWKTAPFMALLILAGLQTISGDLYEAAKVDGASVWQRFRRITLPLLTPAIVVALIFRTLDALRIFDLPQVLTGGANGTTTLSLLAYQELRVNRIIGLGAALSVLTFIIVMTVSFLYIRLVGGNLRELTKDDQ
jgi:multiple sugar transport system permease protein